MGSIRKILNWYSRLTPGRTNLKPPYNHVVQIGDPSLRRISQPVEIDKIQTKGVQKLIERLKSVMKKYGSIGISAPQVGVSLRIFLIEFSKKHLKTADPDIIKTQKLEILPLRVFINPELKVMNYLKVNANEGCESVRGFFGDVARYHSVQISGYDADAKPVSVTYTGWPARIAQHEMDHLDGKLYTDIMDRKTFQCSCWKEINYSRGKVLLNYTP